ncbi:MAG: TraR/DksA C4-type zinc finger protein [Nitrincola lacisaponensis]|uniref:TraR/DksA C4-type zinc finger protein n=1 Tax=Nitrincola lacisaponensis TaxID=267850 RepID=UPI00391CF1B4
MPDLYDRAQEREQANTAAAQRAHAERQTPEPPQQRVAGQVLCIDCDEIVEPRRLEAKPNAARCIHCQTTWERRNGN